MRRCRAAAILATALLALAFPAAAQALGPYPGLGQCQVFPDPPASLSPRAPSLPTQAAWNQDISRAPLARGSGATVAYINRHGGSFLHPDFGSPRTYGFPYAVVGARQRRQPVHYTAYGDESDREGFPIPRGAPVEGGARSDGDRHVLVVDRSRCMLYELYRAFPRDRVRPHWDADSGASWNLRSTALRPDSWTSADAAGLPIFPGRCATRRPPPAGSSTRSGSPSPAPATPGFTPRPTAPATLGIAVPRRWGRACGCAAATAWAASVGRRKQSPGR